MTLGGTRSSSGTKAMLLQLLVVLLFVEQVKNVPVVDDKTLPKGNVQPETLEEIVSDRNELVEGDMLMSTDRNAVGDSWPTTALQYEISPEIKHRTDDVMAAMAMVSEHTCITFHRREPTEKNYVLFQISDGCAAHVGFIGGQQSVFVGPSCNVGNIAHEILHSLGFQHEHTRSDRDDYIEIVQSNIIPGMEKNFKKMSGKTFSVPYDYSSIMHYGRSFFSSNGKPTIIPKINVKEMGQRNKLMETDIKKILLLYNCDSLKVKPDVETKPPEGVATVHQQRAELGLI